jgi:GWxTD domain-containing protein
MAASGPVPFVGRVAYFAGTHQDSALVLVTVSMSTSALEFVREGDRYRADYEISGELRSQSAPRQVVDAKESVRVLSWQETQRTEENIIFQKYFQIQPGNYSFTLSVRDLGRARASNYTRELVVPNTRLRGISTAIVVHEAVLRTSLDAPPTFVASPRSTGLFGRDSVIRAYVEAYGFARRGPVHYKIVNETGATLLADSVSLFSTDEVGSGLLRIPVTSVGIGTGRLRLWVAGGADTVQTPLFVGFGEDLPVASFNDMLNYLRFFVKSERLAALRAAPESERPELWSALVRDTDPNPATTQHESLLAYFDRIRNANEQFRDEATDGWLSDRGDGYDTLGPPERISSPNANQGSSRLIRTMVWEYRRHSLSLYFSDRNGLNRWTIDPSSQTAFRNIAQQERVGQQ